MTELHPFPISPRMPRTIIMECVKQTLILPRKEKYESKSYLVAEGESTLWPMELQRISF